MVMRACLLLKHNLPISSVIVVSRRKMKTQFLAVLFEQNLNILREDFGLNAKIHYRYTIFVYFL